VQGSHHAEKKSMSTGLPMICRVGKKRR